MFKHAWRGVGAFYRKGDHMQKYETVNAPQEYKALKMYPPWDKWIIPKLVLISKLVIEVFENKTMLGTSLNTIRKEPSRIPFQMIILLRSK